MENFPADQYYFFIKRMELQSPHSRFLLASIIPQKTTNEDLLKDLEELKLLVESYGGEVIDLLVQRREVHDKGKYLGKGKLEEAAEVIKEKKIDVVVINAFVKPGHIFDIKKLFWKNNPDIKVWDRVDLILHIFAQHAKTAEAKLQIDLAAMRHMGPRIYGMGMVLSRQAGGIGGRGIGETNTELMRRHWRDQMKKTKDKLEKLATDKQRQLERRVRQGLKTVSIVGYTNAGKTSLFNTLTKKEKYVKNELFATLDSATGKLFLPSQHQEMLVSDTIGFIQNLPPDLIEAFKSTLMESLYADMLLHVIDISDENMEKKIDVVEDILFDLSIHNTKKIYVFNKCDLVSSSRIAELHDKYSWFSPQFVSVKDEKGMTKLLEQIEVSLQTPQKLQIHV